LHSTLTEGGEVAHRQSLFNDFPRQLNNSFKKIKKYLFINRSLERRITNNEVCIILFNIVLGDWHINRQYSVETQQISGPVILDLRNASPFI
jgi:hypothetical protein